MVSLLNHHTTRKNASLLQKPVVMVPTVIAILGQEVALAQVSSRMIQARLEDMSFSWSGTADVECMHYEALLTAKYLTSNI